MKNQSDGRVDRASASGSVDSGFDSESSQTNNSKISIYSFPTRHSAMCHWERHLKGFPHLSVVDGWPATPKASSCSAPSLSVIGR